MPVGQGLPPMSFPEMLNALARQKRSGVLRVSGAEGWKVLELKAGSIRLVTGVSGRRLRLGEVLVARGKVPPDAVRRALEVQKATGVPLGEILVQRGLVSRADVHEIVRFQVEEEIYDLFTWADAQCEFQPDTTLGEQVEDYPGATELQIDPQQVFQEAARRIPVWQRIEKSIYSPYMSFRLTERGQSMLATASRGGRKLLELVQEGCCVDTIVRRTMVGRFAVWKSLTELLEAQAISAIPDAELPGLAERWEAEGALESAWGALMRLSQVTTDRQKIAAFQGRARVLRERISREEAAAEEAAAPGARAVPGQRRPRSARAVFLLAVLVLLVLAGIFAPALGLVGGRTENLGPYREAARRAQELASKGDIAGARDVWEQFLAANPKGMGADLARSAKEIIDEQYEQLVEIEIDKAQRLERAKSYGEAIELYDEILKRYPRTTKQARITDLRNRARRDHEDYVQKLTREELRATLERGKKLFEEKRYSEAREALQNVQKSESAGPELRQEARKELARVEEVEAKAESLVRTARAKEESGSLDEALRIYQECYDLWGSSSWGRVAAERLTELGRDRVRAKMLYDEGLRSYAAGEFAAAVSRLREAERFKGFQVAELASKKLEDIQAARTRSVELLERSRRLAAEGRAEEAFALLVELAERFPHTQAARELKLDIRVESVPQGAKVVRDGKTLGMTPLSLKLGAYESGTLIFSKQGFETHREKFDRVRKPLLRVHLQKGLAFRRSLGHPATAGPVDAHGRFLVRSGATLTAFSTDSGAPIWQVEPGEPPDGRGRPAAIGDIVFVAAPGNRLLALNSATGGPRYDLPLPAAPATSPIAIRLPLLADRVFALVGCRDGQVVLLDALDGAHRWTARVPPPIRSDMAATDRLVFVCSPGGCLDVLDILTGQPRWRQKVPGEIASSPAVDPTGASVGVVTSLGEAYVYSASDGRVLARMVLEGCHGGGIVLDGHAAYIGGDDAKVRAFDTTTGRSLWEARVDGPVRDSPALHEGFVYVGTEKGSLICIETQSAREEWRIDAGSSVVGAPLVCRPSVSPAERLEGGGGSRLVAGTLDGDILGVDIGPATSPSSAAAGRSGPE